MAEGETTFTQADLDAAIDAAKQPLIDKRTEALDEAKAAKTKARELEGRLTQLEQQQAAAASGITSEALDAMRADIDKEYQPLKDQLATLQGENHTLKLVDKVHGIMAENGVLASKVSALYRLEGEAFDLTDDGVPMLKDNPGGDIGKFVADTLSEKYPEWFEGSGSSGGGAPKSIPGGSGRVGTIAADDGDSFLANVDKIATGEVQVR